jgi:hypothetical protein
MTTLISFRQIKTQNIERALSIVIILTLNNFSRYGSSYDELQSGKDKQIQLAIRTFNDRYTRQYIQFQKQKYDNLNLYLLEVKRIILIEKLSGLTKSLHKSSREFVIHVTGEHDYRFKSDMYVLIFLNI